METYHVEIGKCTQGAPKEGPSFYWLHPHQIREQHAEDGNALVVIRPCYRSWDVARYYGNHCCRNQTCSWILCTRKWELMTLCGVRI